MNGGGLVEALRAHPGWRTDPFGTHAYCVGRRCQWTYVFRGDDPGDRFAAHLADVVTAHLAARLEGCREEVTRAAVAEGEDYSAVADQALAVVREALGLPPGTQGAALRASDGAGGPEGHREATRAGDGL